MGSIRPSEVPPAPPIAGRYRIERELGRGGMAVVYEVVDESSGASLALKRLLTHRRNSSTAPDIERLFEQEYLTLARLSHPRVVEAYDFDRDQDGPFYTMELLDGGDLRELAPVPWAEACALLRDVCSALSLLHSRRLVHRDLTPRNVRCTRDGKAKLIDFGAMMPFGPCKQVVGTPSFTAPEALAAQTIDARADLFALGATAYFALTGRHAYPARHFSSLRDAWRSPPPAPSRIVADVPEALDRLVMSLLHLSALARPSSAAEVIERLSAIAGLPLDEQLLVPQAYLSTPNLEGRESTLFRVRKQVLRAQRGHGGSILVSGAPGVGRSRFLDACVLEGKLAGVTVLRGDASDTGHGPWSVARALAQQLVEALPAQALDAAVPLAAPLAAVLPELADRLREAGHEPPAAPYDSPQALRAAVHAAFREWLLALSRSRAIVLAVDDVHRIDEPSAALIASLAYFAHGHPMLVVATAERGRAQPWGGAVALLEKAGASIKLRRLSREDVERLVASVFGDVPNVKLLADRLFAVSEGHPREVMQLAQYLLDRGTVRYEAGAWTLPERIDEVALPSSLSEALAARLRTLGERPRRLAEALALCSLDTLGLDDCLVLGLHPDAAALSADLDALIAREVVIGGDGRYALAQPSIRRVLVDELEAEVGADLHRRLSRMFGAMEQHAFRAARHSLLAGDDAEAIAHMLRHAHAADARRGDPVAAFEDVRDLPADWRQTLERVLSLAEQSGQPAREVFLLRGCLVAGATLGGGCPPVDQLLSLLAQLRHDSGLDLYESLDEPDPGTRLRRAIELAQQRFDATPEEERVLAPFDAIGRLAQSVVVTIGVAGRSFDYPLLERAPSLSPLAPLSPALAIVSQNQQASLHVLAGRTREARDGFRAILARMEQEDAAGFDHRAYTYMLLAIRHTIGAIEINAGIPSGVEWADKVEDSPLFGVNAWRMRMLHALRQGDWDLAEAHRAQLELMQIQNSPPQIFEGSHLWPELQAYVAVEDLLRVKQAIPAVAALAGEMPSWEPCACFARGCYHLLRGDLSQATAELERGLSLVTAGRHVAWSSIAGGLLSALERAGRVEEAVERGHAMLVLAEREGLTALRHYIETPLSLAEAAAGDHEAAVERAERVIAYFEALGSAGVPLGNAYETRARVAVLLNDRPAFERYAALCGAQYRTGHNPALTAKYERLVQFARKWQLEVSGDLAHAADSTDAARRDVGSRIATLLSACRGSSERAQETLRCLVDHSQCAGGFLYLMQPEGPALRAEIGGRQPPAELDTQVRRHVEAELVDAEEATATVQGGSSNVLSERWSTEDGARLVPVVLAHESPQGFVITGVAALLPGPTGVFRSPDELLPLLSRALLESGDAVTAFAS